MGYRVYISGRNEIVNIPAVEYLHDGDAIAIDDFWGHQAIVRYGPDGTCWAYHNDKTWGISYEPFADVHRGRGYHRIGQPDSQAHCDAIFERADAALMLHPPYSATSWNCESFVHFCYYGAPHSESVRTGVLWLGIGALGAAVWSANRE